MIEIDQLEDGIIKALIHLLYEWIYTVEHGFLLCLIRDDMDIAMDADGELARWLHVGEGGFRVSRKLLPNVLRVCRPKIIAVIFLILEFETASVRRSICTYG